MLINLVIIFCYVLKLPNRIELVNYSYQHCVSLAPC